MDEEESYFEGDDDEGCSPNTVVPPAVDEVAAQDVENELHRTPRMFSLAQAPLLNGRQIGVGSVESREKQIGQGSEIQTRTQDIVEGSK